MATNSKVLIDLAERIPEEFRKEIVELEMIKHATAQVGNQNMHYLATIWKEYIDPQFEPVCGLCLASCLDGFRQLEPILNQLSHTAKLLDDL